MTGFEPVTSSLPRKRDYQLCYMGIKKAYNRKHAITGLL